MGSFGVRQNAPLTLSGSSPVAVPPMVLWIEPCAQVPVSVAPLTEPTCTSMFTLPLRGAPATGISVRPLIVTCPGVVCPKKPAALPGMVTCR